MTEYITLEEARREREEARRRENGSGGGAGPEIKLLDPITLQGKPVPPRRWLVPGLIPWRNVVLFSGDGGLGKSLLMLQLQVATATGRRWIGRDVEPCRSLGLYCEDEADELHRRLDNIRRHHEVEFGDLENMTTAPRVGEDNLLGVGVNVGVIEPTDLYGALLKNCRDFGAQLVIIDTVADVYGANENIRAEVRTFVGLMRRLAIEIDGSVMLTSHPSQAGLNTGTGISGSTAWHASVRSRLYLTQPGVDEGDEQRPDERVLKTMKSNYGPAGDDIGLTWRDGVFVADDEDTPTVASIKRGNAEKTFLELLDKLTKQGRDVSPKSAATNYAPKVMGNMPDRDRLKRRDLERAMENLFACEAIVAVDYGPPSRGWKQVVRAKTDD